MIKIISKKEYNRLKHKSEQYHDELHDIKRKTKDLLWNIGNQQEKVGSNLTSLIKMLYPYMDKQEHRYSIKSKILAGMSRFNRNM